MTETPNTVTIRQAVTADLETVAALTDAAYHHYVPIFGRKPQPMVTDYAPMIAADEVWLLVVSGQAVGLIILVDEGDKLLIYSIAVDPQFQKQGLGRWMLAWAEGQTHAAGYGVIRLYTNALMTRNIALYGRIGYVETGRETFPGGTIVHMVKRLET